MVEELKLAIKVDDDAIEQSLLKQFANAEKMANKVVLTFNNIDLDDKAIETKFKEMQKMAGKNPIDLSIDKSSIEMLSAISKQLGNIFDIAKGKSLIDSSATVADVNKITQSTNQQVKAVEKVTSSYKNQAYELASILKMLAKFDKYDEVPYAAAMSKAIKSDAKSYKNGNTIQFAPKKYGMDEDSLKYLRGLSVNLSGAFNYIDTLGLDTANINNLEILIKYYRELLKEKLEFNNIKLNTSDTEELIKALGILKKEHFDDDTKSGRNVYGDAYLDKYSNLDMIKDYLKEQEKQAIATAQAEQKLADAEKEVVKSSIPESQNKIQEELKETQKQAEQTSESLSNIADGNKSNISSENSIRSVLPSDSEFKNVIANLDLTKSKLSEIVKITRQAHADKDGKFYESFTLTDRYGSTETYGESSKTSKGQLLNYKYVEQNAKAAEQEAKAQQQLTEAMAKGREHSEKLRQSEEKRQQIAQNNAINKALEQEYQERQKNIQAAEKQAELDKQKALAFTKSASDKLSSAISKYSYGDSSDATAMMKQMNRGLSNFGDLSNVKGNITQLSSIIDKIIADLKVSHEQSLLALNEEIKSEQKLQAQKDAFHKKNISAIDLEIQKREEEAKSFSSSLKSQMEERQKQLSSMESTVKGYYKDYDNRNIKPTSENRSFEYQQALDKYLASIKELETEQKRLSQLPFISDEELSKFRELEERVQENANAFKSMSAAQKGSTEASRWKEIDKISKYLEKNTKLSKEAKQQLNEYITLLKSGSAVNIEEIHRKFNEIAVAERMAGREGKSFFDIFKNKAIYGFASKLAMYYLSFYDFIRYARYGIDTLKEFDNGLTKISYTMDMTKSQLDNLGNSVLDMAKDLDSSIDNAMQVAQIYANMNTSAEEIKKLSEPTLILSNLTGFDASTVADDIQAVTQQFDIAAESSMHIADVYDQISRNISVDYSKGIESIAEAVQVAGSTAKQAGLSFEQLAAIVGKTAEKTRLEGSQIGNGLKTIMTRLSKVGELSDEVDPETLSDASESLHKIGIEVYNADGSFRKFDVIMGELANKWDTLSDAEKSNISFSIAATRQTNLLSSILSNFSDSMSMAEEATHANGNALENNQKWVDSFGGHLQSLENTAKSAWINILDSETIKGGVDLLNILLERLTKFIDTVGVLPTLAGIGGVVAGIKNVGQAKMWACLIYAYPC